MSCILCFFPDKIWNINMFWKTLFGLRPTDVHLRPIQWRRVFKFITWTMSSFVYFEFLCGKMFFTLQKHLNIYPWVLKCGFWKGTKDAGESRGKRPIKSANSSTALSSESINFQFQLQPFWRRYWSQRCCLQMDGDKVRVDVCYRVSS